MLRRSALFIEFGKRIHGRVPFVALLIFFPRFGKAILKPHISAWIRRSTETNLIPCPRMRVVRGNAVFHQ